jgi:hypothetical protein
MQLRVYLGKQHKNEHCSVNLVSTSGSVLPHLHGESVSREAQEQSIAFLQAPTSVLLIDNRFLPFQLVLSSSPYQQDAHICKNTHIQKDQLSFLTRKNVNELSKKSLCLLYEHFVLF